MKESYCRAGLFETSHGLLALPLERLQTVLETPRVFPLPGVGDTFQGVMLYRNQAVPLIEWPSRGHTGPAEVHYVALVETDYGLVGLPVDRVRHIAEGRVDFPVSPSWDDLPAVVGAFRHGSKIYPLINIEQLVENLTSNP